MALLSQALHLGYLLSPHSAFQGHAAHTARWPAMLSPNGSSDTCISDGVFHIPMPCFHGATPGSPAGTRVQVRPGPVCAYDQSLWLRHPAPLALLRRSGARPDTGVAVGGRRGPACGV